MRLIKGIPEKEYYKAYREKNKDKIAKVSKAYYEKNKDKLEIIQDLMKDLNITKIKRTDK